MTGGSVPPPPHEVTVEEREARLAYVESLYLAGLPSRQIFALAAQPPVLDATGKRVGGGIGVKASATKILLAEIRQSYADDWKSREAFRRTDQMARLQRHLAQMASEGGRKPWAQIMRAEQLISEVEGNLAPRRLELEVRDLPDALAQVIAGMSRDDVARVLAEERARASSGG